MSSVLLLGGETGSIYGYVRNAGTSGAVTIRLESTPRLTTGRQRIRSFGRSSQVRTGITATRTTSCSNSRVHPRRRRTPSVLRSDGYRADRVPGMRRQALHPDWFVLGALVIAALIGVWTASLFGKALT